MQIDNEVELEIAPWRGLDGAAEEQGESWWTALRTLESVVGAASVELRERGREKARFVLRVSLSEPAADARRE